VKTNTSVEAFSIPFYHIRTRASVALINEQAKEELNRAEITEVQAGVERETSYHLSQGNLK
jgi:hypothetical protein